MKKTYYGNAISTYGLEQGYVDYHAFAQAFSHILWNYFVEVCHSHTVEVEMGEDYYWIDKDGNRLTCEEYDKLDADTQDECQEEYVEFYQYYIVGDEALYYLKENNETVYYIPDLNLYVWAVSHFGTSWDYVLTNIKINKDEE